MKKFFDRYLFSRLGLQILFSVLFILLFSLAGTVLRNWATGHSASDVYSQTFWGFRQITDGGSMAGTLDGLDEVAAESRHSFGAPVVLVVALVSWLVGMVLYGFVAGAVANAFAGRKEKIDAGLVRYRFRGHGVVIGWDFQGVATVLALLDEKGPWKCREVVVLSERPAADIRSELATELDEKTLSRVFIYNGSAGVAEDRAALWAHKARVIVILGDQNESNNDGGNMRLSILLGNEIENALRKESGKSAPTKNEDGKPEKVLPEPIPMFVDVTGLHALRPMRRFPKSGENWPNVSVRIVNFFEESAHELFSSVSRLVETGEERVPLHFRTNPDATHAHLVVSGFDPMAQALVLRAARILGAGSEPDRITVFTTDEAAATRFRGAFPVDRLLNVRVEFVPADIADPAQSERLATIARDRTASVTLAVCEDVPDKALETFACLPRSLRFENIRILVELRCLSKWAWEEFCLRQMGYERVTFFGFTDRYLSSADDREAAFRVSPEEAEKGDYDEPPVAPAFLETLAVCGFRPIPAGDGPDHVFDDGEIERLARTAQNGRANGILLDGREPGPRSIAGLFVSSRIRPWEELSEENRAEIRDEWRKTLAVMAGILSSGKVPLRIAPTPAPALRIGILPSGKPLWTNRKEKDECLARLEAADAALRSKASLKGDATWPSFTVLSADPTDPESLKLVQWYSANKVRLDAILPSSPETCAAAISDQNDREDFLRLLRRAWDVTVAPGGDVAACIRAQATTVASLEDSSQTPPTQRIET